LGYWSLIDINKQLRRIQINDISKVFNTDTSNNSILLRLLSLFTGKELQKPFKALTNISLDAYDGENIGIIGKNGSGKSTLLRLIANIYPHNGKIITNGKLFYTNGFGLGFRQRLTMRENIYLVGLIMGLSKSEINEIFDEIVSFSELNEFLDTKVYKFSSGMINRLRFSVTIHCLEYKKPEIILLDEVFGGGGDISFQDKALEKIKEFIESNATVILVSHDMNIIRKYCDRVIFIHDGQIISDGDPEKTIDAYLTLIKKPKTPITI